jgi:hypothetical protein
MSVFGADGGEPGDLVPAQAGDPSWPCALGKPGVAGGEFGAASLQEFARLGEVRFAGHAFQDHIRHPHCERERFIPGGSCPFFVSAEA